MAKKKSESLIVEKDKFDKSMQSILKAKPLPRNKVKTKGKFAPKTPILAKP